MFFFFSFLWLKIWYTGSDTSNDCNDESNPCATWSHVISMIDGSESLHNCKTLVYVPDTYDPKFVRTAVTDDKKCCYFNE